MHFRIRRGLDLPITGAPRQTVQGEVMTDRVGVMGPDFIGMKPTMLVKVGDRVKLGQKIIEDKKNLGVFYTAPASGIVEEINRGDARVFLSCVIKREGQDKEAFPRFDLGRVSNLSRADVQKNLIESGMWTAFRTRPFSRSPVPGSTPSAIFVTAMDSQPLAADAQMILSANKAAFNDGVKILTRLTDGSVHVCTRPQADIFTEKFDRVATHSFAGPHPAGLAGTHMHMIDPVHEKKMHWSIGYQDVIAIGHLFRNGEIFTDRWISIAGPRAKEPKVIKTHVGADLMQILKNAQEPGENRLVSGSPLSGRKLSQELRFLGRFHLQATILEEDRKRELFGWQMPGASKFSVKRVFASAPFFWKRFAMGTNTNGSPRAMVPVGSYEKVVPLDIVPTFFLRSLLCKDTEKAVALGGLELDEEDLALCTFVCPGKSDYAPLLRSMLMQFEKEG